MQKYPLPKRSGKDLVEICGTRYHRISIINNDECLFIGIVSTPLTKDELDKFIINRVGCATCTFFGSEVSQADASSDKYAPAVMGLSTFETVLKQFVPEQILEEKTVRVTTTNKGIKIEELSNKGDE